MGYVLLDTVLHGHKRRTGPNKTCSEVHVCQSSGIFVILVSNNNYIRKFRCRVWYYMFARHTSFEWTYLATLYILFIWCWLHVIFTVEKITEFPGTCMFTRPLGKFHPLDLKFLHKTWHYKFQLFGISFFQHVVLPQGIFARLLG